MNDSSRQQHLPKPLISTELSAWLVLSVFFVASLVVLALLGRVALANYNAAMRTLDGAQLRSHVTTGVLYQEPRSLSSRTLERLPDSLDPCAGEKDICLPLKPAIESRLCPPLGMAQLRRWCCPMQPTYSCGPRIQAPIWSIQATRSLVGPTISKL